MKRRLKRLLAAGLCLCLLVGVTACGEVEKTSYQQALDAIDAEDYETAYTLLKESKDRRAAEELEKFVFVPVKVTDKNSLGTDETTLYTYDDLGNLLSKKVTDPTGGRLIEYTYSGYKKIAYRYQSKNNNFGNTYTYDAAGNLVLVRYLDRNGAWLGQTTYTYDEKGNCLSEETARMDEAQDLTPQLESTHYYTYDTEGRVLLEKNTYYYEGEFSEGTVTYYTYEADGSYCRVMQMNDGENGELTRTYTYYHDAEGRELRGERRYDNEPEPYHVYEYRYNERGDVEYYRFCNRGKESVTTYVYDQQGRLLEEDTTDLEGEPRYLERNTYDDRGNRLTHEEVHCDTGYWQNIKCTYDAQDCLLTQKNSYQGGWEDNTYVYDEKGNKISETGEGSSASYTKSYQHDQWGNVIASSQYTNSYGAEYAYEYTAQWELRYYPKGVPEEVQEAITASQRS